MKKLFYKIYTRLYQGIYFRYCHFMTLIYFQITGVSYKKFTSIGMPLLDIHYSGICKLGDDLVMVNKAKFATLGKNNRCKLLVAAHATLTLGNKIGMSNATIISTSSVTLGNNIMIGGGVVIVDNDFHSLNPAHWHTDQDPLHMKSDPVIIKDNVFIGMDSIILKGVTIGNNVIIAAGSVVVKSIPDYEIWGGNPAKFIRHNLNN